MMFLLMVRVDDPLVPRAIFGILNTLLFFPSGAIYPIQAFPWWLRAIAKVDPFSFAVHGFKTLLLKEAGLSAIVPDIIYLSLFAVVALSIEPLCSTTCRRTERVVAGDPPAAFEVDFVFPQRPTRGF